MKIGDLWVKLGLKKDEFSRGIKQADGEVKSFAGGMKSLSAIGAAAWAAVSAAVVKFAKDAISMTQKWGDQWSETMAGIKGAYSSFVRQISSGDGWNNLFANMREAYRVSKEVAAALDEIFERKVSYSYQEADTERQIAQLQLIARDSSKSEADRIDANKKIITLTEDLGKAKKAIYEDEAAQHRKLFASQTHLNDEQIDFLVKEYNQNREIINQAREYLKQKKELSKVGGTGFFTESVGPIPSPVAKQQPISPELERLERETPQAIKDIADLTKMYDRANDDLVRGMADAEVAVIRIDTETAHAQTRATSLLGTLQRVGSASDGIKKGKVVDPLEQELELIRQDIEEQDELLAEDEALNEWSRNWIESFAQLNGISLDPLGDEIREFTDTVLDEVDRQEMAMDRMKEMVMDFREAIMTGFFDATQEMMDQLFGLQEYNPGRIVQALLTPLADMAIKAGEIIMAEGAATIAANSALMTFGETGWGAIAAGAALAAAGAAAKAGLSAIAQSAGAATATTSYGSGTSATSGAQTQTIQTEMTVYVTGRLSGSDILLSGQKTQNNWNR